MTTRVTVEGSGLRIGTELVPMWSAEMHYSRLDPADWPRILDAIRDLGFTAVSSYLPWSQHERGTGGYDFTGRLDIARFWSLAAERGLHVLVRPGPNSGAEFEDSGWSHRVLTDPECQARRPDGRSYLLPTATGHAFMPSYGSRTTLARVGEWYDVVAPLIAAHQWPDGPIVACQVDNEMGYHFQPHPFALDYHPDTVAQWHEWRGTAVDPPRDGRSGPVEERLAWVEFREHHLRRSLATLAGMLRARGVDRVPLTHNDYPRTTTPFDSAALEQAGAIDVATGDVYATRHGGRFVRDYARHLSGTSKLPWLAEAGVGWITLPWLLPMAVDPADAEHNLWRALSGGVRAFNVFMAVERDRWYAAPISATGEVRPQAAAYRRILATLREQRWHTLRRRPPVLLVENRDEARRAAATATRGDLAAPFTQMLPLDPRLFAGDAARAAQIADWERSWRARLDEHRIDADAAASSSLTDLTGYHLVLVAGRDRLGDAASERLAKAEADGLRVVSDDVAPGEVALDDVVPSTVRVEGDVDDGVDVTLFHRADGARVLLAVNGTDQPASARFAEGEVDLDPWGAGLVVAS